jgi:hypothetical protein
MGLEMHSRVPEAKLKFKNFKSHLLRNTINEQELRKVNKHEEVIFRT